MDRAALAKKIRQAIFDQAEEDGRVMHADAMDKVIESVLAKAETPAGPKIPASVWRWATVPGTGGASAVIGDCPVDNP